MNSDLFVSLNRFLFFTLIQGLRVWGESMERGPLLRTRRLCLSLRNSKTIKPKTQFFPQLVVKSWEVSDRLPLGLDYRGSGGGSLSSTGKKGTTVTVSILPSRQPWSDRSLNRSTPWETGRCAIESREWISLSHSPDPFLEDGCDPRDHL